MVAARRPIELVGAAWGLGGAEPGCADAPGTLAPLLAGRLAQCGERVVPGPMLSPPPSERRRQLAVSRLCALLASTVADALRCRRLPCVIGGDHTCAGGTWTGVARALDGPLGMVWVDAHMDAHTPATSHSGRLHGMPLAWLLGEDDDPLYGLAAGVLEPQHVCLLGVRSFEPEEEARLRKLGVRVLHMAEIERRGTDEAFDEALAIATRGTAAFGISIDLDVVTPEEAAAVGTPVRGGMRGAALARSLERIGGRPDLAAVELVEYCPRLDRGGGSARIAVDLMAAALCGPREEANVVPEALDR